MTSLGLNIKKIRERWDLTQEEFGLLIGATRGMVMQYEKRGTRPKNETVSQIIKLTGITWDMLANGELADDDLPEMDMESQVAISNFREDPDTYRDLQDKDVQELLKTNGRTRNKMGHNGDGDGHQVGYDPEFVEFLKSNDAFFKNQYTAFNAQVLANLTALVNQAKTLEALLKINLEHTGNIEAAQLGVPKEQVHDNINRDILAAAGVRIDNAVGSPGKG